MLELPSLYEAGLHSTHPFAVDNQWPQRVEFDALFRAHLDLGGVVGIIWVGCGEKMGGSVFVAHDDFGKRLTCVKYV